MRKMVLLLAMSLLAAAWGAPYHPEKTLTVPGAYFLTPALSSPRFAVFGYIAKTRPTPEEIEAESARIRQIIESGIRREYGSWEKYGEAMKRAGKESAAKAASEEPAWARTLMPPSLIEKAVPLFMKGVLQWAMAHPEARTEPFGNVGETGILLLDGKGGYTKIPLGIDQPVVSLDISPDGRYVAALCDMSTEDESGRLHTAGRIVLVDRKGKRCVSNAFSPMPATKCASAPTGAGSPFCSEIRMRGRGWRCGSSTCGAGASKKGRSSLRGSGSEGVSMAER